MFKGFQFSQIVFVVYKDLLKYLERQNYFRRIHHLFPPPSNQTLKLHHKAELGFQLGSGAHRKVTGKWWQKGRKGCLENTIIFLKKHCNFPCLYFNRRASWWIIILKILNRNLTTNQIKTIGICLKHICRTI